jgi:hypothetical protein
VICCQYAAGGGGVFAVIFAVAAAIEGAEWVLARIWWIAGWSAAVLAVAVVIVSRLARRARARDTAPLALWRGAPAQLHADPVAELPRAQPQAIAPVINLNFYGVPDERAATVIRTAIEGTAPQ